MQNQFITIFPTELRSRLKNIDDRGLEEIRIRIGWPMEFIYDNRSEWFGASDCMMDRRRLDEMLNYITGYSAYAMEEELKQGFLPMEGGHRIGITGHASYEAYGENGQPQITSLVDIGGLNIRIAHEKKNCAKEMIPYIRKETSIYNTLFFAAPGVGKTTYLRDAIRILSSGDHVYRGLKCCVVDERSEIAACVQGKPQNDLGKRCDVLDACPKLLGMKMVLRSMSPEIIAVDELGKKEEFDMLWEIRSSGVKIIGTIHAGMIEEVLDNPFLHHGTIERFVELKKKEDGSRIFFIYDKDGYLLSACEAEK